MNDDKLTLVSEARLRELLAKEARMEKLEKVAKAAARRADATKTVEWIDKYH